MALSAADIATLQGDLVGLLARRVTIETPTEVVSSEGARTMTYATLAGHANLPALIVPSGGLGVGVEERREPAMTVEADTYRVRLAGYYPAIRPRMRMRDDAALVYDITGVSHGPFNATTSMTAHTSDPGGS